MTPRVAILLVMGLSLLCVSRARCATLLSLYPILVTTEGYNDNIELTANKHKGDFVTTVLGGFSLDFNGPARTGSFQYDTLVQTFASHSQFNSYAGTNFLSLSDQENFSPTLNLYVYDSTVIGSITGGVLATNSGAVSSQVAQSAVANTSGVSNVFGLQLNKKLGEFWSTTLAAQQSFYSSSFQTYYIQGGGPSLLYALRPELQVGVSYTFLDFRFSNQSASETHVVQALARWNPTERLKLDLSAGILLFDNLGGSPSIQAKPAGLGSIIYTGERWTITGSGGQVASGTGGLGGAGVAREAYGVINYALQRHTSLNFGASYSKFVGGGSNSQFLSYGAGISTRPYKWLTLFALYQGFQDKVSATSNVAALTTPLGKTATSNTYTLGLTITFDAFDYSI
jgi:hypothetical protein